MCIYLPLNIPKTYTFLNCKLCKKGDLNLVSSAMDFQVLQKIACQQICFIISKTARREVIAQLKD